MSQPDRPLGETEADLALDRTFRDAARERLAPEVGEPPQPRDASRRRRHVLVLAGASLLLLVGGLAGWFARDFTGGPRPTAGRAWAGLARDAVSAHRTFVGDVARPVEVKADQEAYLAQWLTTRLKRPVVVPDLTDAFGFDLLGGRLLPAGQDIAAFLMYADRSGARLTLYLRQGEVGDNTLNFMREGEVSTFAWVANGTGYVVAASMERERLQKIARAVQQEYELEAARRRRAL